MKYNTGDMVWARTGLCRAWLLCEIHSIDGPQFKLRLIHHFNNNYFGDVVGADRLKPVDKPNIQQTTNHRLRGYANKVVKSLK